jgi:hypothetical protein
MAEASAEPSAAADRTGAPAPHRRAAPLGLALPAIAPARVEANAGPAPAEPEAWRRIALGDDAELLIRESAYRRRRELVDWLIAWARRVFG